MKVVGVIILIAMYGTIIYVGIRAAIERRKNRYKKFFEQQVVDSIDFDEYGGVDEEV